jgi:DNA-binding transcriptional MerR regulator
MTISQVAKLLDLTPDTLRYYEKIGLIPRIERDASGNRNYSEGNCNWIRFIKCMRKAGLTVDALKEYVTLLAAGDATKKRRKEILLDQRKRLQEQVDMIQGTMEYLDVKILGYEERIFPKEKQLIAEIDKDEESFGA